jgi:hypothetical protein
VGTGGSSSGVGVIGNAGGGNADGVQGTGVGTGRGVYGLSGLSGGYGVGGQGAGTGSGGVYGESGGGSGAGVRGYGTDLGPGVYGESVGGVGVQAVSGTGIAAIRADVTGTSTSINSASSALQLRNTANVNNSVVSLSMVHSDGADPPDGWVIRTLRGADSDVDMLLMSAVDSATPSEVVRADLSASTIRPALDNTWSLGAAGNRWANVTTNRSTADISVITPSTVQALGGTGIAVSVGAGSLIPVSSAAVGTTVSTLTGGVDGQFVTILVTGSNSIQFNHTASGADTMFLTVSDTIVPNRTISFVRYGGSWKRVA